MQPRYYLPFLGLQKFMEYYQRSQKVEHIEVVKEGDRLGKERKQEGREWGDYNTRFARFFNNL